MEYIYTFCIYLFVNISCFELSRIFTVKHNHGYETRGKNVLKLPCPYIRVVFVY